MRTRRWLHSHSWTPWEPMLRPTKFVGKSGTIERAETFNVRRCTDPACQFVQEVKAEDVLQRPTRLSSEEQA